MTELQKAYLDAVLKSTDCFLRGTLICCNFTDKPVGEFLGFGEMTNGATAFKIRLYKSVKLVTMKTTQ